MLYGTILLDLKWHGTAVPFLQTGSERKVLGLNVACLYLRFVKLAEQFCSFARRCLAYIARKFSHRFMAEPVMLPGGSGREMCVWVRKDCHCYWAAFGSQCRCSNHSPHVEADEGRARKMRGSHLKPVKVVQRSHADMQP